MNLTVNRETDAMRHFSSEAYALADEMDDIASRMTQLVYDASDHMQDNSGREAISIIEELIEEIRISAAKLYDIGKRVQASAVLLEEADTML